MMNGMQRIPRAVSSCKNRRVALLGGDCKGSKLLKTASFVRRVLVVTHLILAFIPIGRVNAEGLEEITVTATRREEFVSKVPVSITAFSADQLNDLGIKNFADVVKFTPGATLTSGSNTISIRGIGSSSGAATTGIYLDETPIQQRGLSFARQSMPSSFDLERIEVLRGPQGTLFGAGSEGGTVRYILAQPSLTNSKLMAKSEISFTQGGEPNFEIGAAGSTPISTDVFAMHASVMFSRVGGWIDRLDPSTLNNIDPNTNRSQSSWARLAATWAPAENIIVSPSVVHQSSRTHDQPYIWNILSSGSSLNSADPVRQPDDDQFTLGSVKVAIDWDAVQLISNTSYYNRKDKGTSYDGTLYLLGYYQALGWAPNANSGAVGSSPYLPYQGTACATLDRCYPLLDASGVHLPASLQGYRAFGLLTQTQQSWTQEFRLQSEDANAPLTWTTGLFASVERTTSYEELRDSQVDQLFGGLFGATLAGAYEQPTNPDGSTFLPNGNSYSNHLRSTDRQYALFGSVSWAITSNFRLTGGLRWAHTQFDIDSFSDGPTNYGPLASNGKASERPITKRLAIDFQPDSGSLYYGSFSTGFRQGGANSLIPAGICDPDFAAFGIPGAPLSYGSDTVKSYEIGAKKNWNNRVRFGASAYHIKWEGVQQSVLLPTCALFYIANLGEAVSNGVDLDLKVLLGESLELQLAAGYTDAHFSKPSLPGPSAGTPIVRSGSAVAVTGSGAGGFSQPTNPWTVSAAIQKETNFLKHPLTMRLEYQYMSKNGRRLAAQDPETVQYDSYLTTPSSFSSLGAHASWQWDSLEWRLFADNIQNRLAPSGTGHTATDGFGPQPPAQPLSYFFTGRPRTIGITTTYRF